MRLDHLEDLAKARKAKGLSQWKKLEHLKDKLVGKQASHITYTTSYPGQEGSKKYLGSATGNLYFLLGYVNPGFYVAPYHWQLVDPNLSDEEARKKEHPANPRYWKEAGLEITEEGDFEEGKPHKSALSDKKAAARRKARTAGAVTVQSGYATFVASPKDGVVYSLSSGHPYKWGLIRESYLSATNPKLRELMDEFYEEGVGEEEYEAVDKSLSNRVPFSQNVYPLVRKALPLPGSWIPVEDFYGVVRPDKVEFVDSRGTPVSVRVFDREYTSFDLTKGGDIHPSILLQFLSEYADLNKSELEQFIHTEEDTL